MASSSLGLPRAFFFFITASHFPILLNTEDISDVHIASFTHSALDLVVFDKAVALIQEPVL